MGAKVTQYYRNKEDENIKNLFLNRFCKTSKERSDWRNKFRELCKIEDIYGVEFYKLTEEQIVNGFMQLNSPRTLGALLTRLDAYADWFYNTYKNKCIEENIYIGNKFFSSKVSQKEINQYIARSKTIPNLHRSQRDFYVCLENDKIELREKISAALIYEGFSPKDIENIKVEDVNFDKSIIYNNKIPINVNKNTLKLMNQCVLDPHYNNFNDGAESYSLDDKEYLYRRSTQGYSKEDKEKKVAEKLSIVNRDLDMRVGVTEIKESAIMHFLMNIEASQNRDVTVSDAADALIKFTTYDSSRYANCKSRVEMYKLFKENFNINSDNIHTYVDTDYNSSFIPLYNNEDSKLPDNKYPQIPPLANKYPKGAKSIGEHNAERGEKGESIVLAELMLEYKNKNEEVRDVVDSAGYDFQIIVNNITHKLIEVKTLYNITDTFHISKNELKIADRYPTYYWIYFVGVGEDMNYKIYKLNNPVSGLGIDVENLFKNDTVDFEKCVLSKGDYTIKIPNPEKVFD